ncbi:FAD-binding oxidoreductase [Solicola gregarius]|uniref:FAD-binding protein n=1 Tax=Solicola gregarius TaxID=2908642 RepID=A0AA46TFF5_9ACTN|nr:FAD-linked oxidase C-terminal domain-containing protein [Solicola gregarius]UYM04116.1 FAD-binding protein [Solicola gregarius]
MSDRAAAVLSALAERLPGDCVITDPDLMESYRVDRAMFCAAGTPLAVVLPRETAQVSAVLEVASEHAVPVVPQGARSGLSGAANAIEGCLVVGLERMAEVRHIDVANRYVVTQPGVMNAELSRAVEAEGLFYPPDPSSWEFCSIGGNLSTNSGGLCCVKYGVTTDYVLGLEVVLASGEVLRTGRRTVKGVAGYDLTKLFVGSEGTLGIITEATLSLRPAAQRPETLAATFDDAERAAEGVSAVVGCGIVPSLLEFMDRTSVQAVNDAFKLGFDPEVGAVVIAQSDAGGSHGREEVDHIAKVLADSGATQVVVADDPAEGELLLKARREVLTAFERLGTTLIDDVCVPRDALGALVKGIDAIAAEHDLVIGVVGHAGDGNFHPTVVFDGQDEDESRRAKQAFDDVMTLGLDLGGTITGEHGVGVLKRDLLAREVGDLGMRVHRDIKHALDPHDILNPGKVF